MQPKNVACLIFVAILFLTAWGGCRSGGTSADGSLAPTRTPVPSVYIGSLDEVIGPEGPVAPEFNDAEYQQLRRPDAIAPIYDPEFLSADESDLPADELVIGLDINGEARAYPAGILYNREMVNDTIGGVPVLITWCPRCYTALVHDRSSHGAAHLFGNQGALYKGAMTWYDHATGSVWSQPTGEAIAGPMAGATLTLLPSQLTTWGEWLSANPASRVLASDIPSTPYSGRRPGEDHVAGVLVGEQAVAWPYRSILDAGSITTAIGGVNVTISVDEPTGAIRAVAGNGESRELPVIIAYRWAWEEFYPDR